MHRFSPLKYATGSAGEKNRLGFTKNRAISPFRSHQVTKDNREQVVFCTRGVSDYSLWCFCLRGLRRFPPTPGFHGLVLLHPQLFSNPSLVRQMGLTRRLRFTY